MLLFIKSHRVNLLEQEKTVKEIVLQKEQLQAEIHQKEKADEERLHSLAEELAARESRILQQKNTQEETEASLRTSLQEYNEVRDQIIRTKSELKTEHDVTNQEVYLLET